MKGPPLVEALSLFMAFSIRDATLDDVPALHEVIAESTRGLMGGDYTKAQIEAALGNAFGVDTELIRDRTYFIVESEHEIVACGGWSRRKTMFGADGRADRESVLLDPAVDSARIRAFFVRPAWARRGIGRLLLERCEQEAARAGFRSVELMATLPGQRLYSAFGYLGDARVDYDLGQGVRIDFVPMRKALEPSGE
jgi:GNAT superfamily N-acetyltransferase